MGKKQQDFRQRQAQQAQRDKDKQQNKQQNKQQTTEKQQQPITVQKAPQKKKTAAQELKIKQRAEQLRKQQEKLEQERKEREERERKEREEQERLRREAEEQQEQEEKQHISKKEKKLAKQRAQLGIQKLLDDDPEIAAQQQAELLQLLQLEAEEKRQQLKQKNMEIDKKLAQEKQIKEEQEKEKQQNDNEDSWMNDSIEDGEDWLNDNDNEKEQKEVSDIEHSIQSNNSQDSISKQVKYRSGIIVVCGHVDTGKTSILDKIRHSSIQAKEVGGITQQIGASFLSDEYITEKIKNFPYADKVTHDYPGLLFIDTPGHESFASLRSRGSSMADLAVLVVDLMHGIEQQTIESINLFKQYQTPFVIAVNKVDRCYKWNSSPDASIKTQIKKQSSATLDDFKNKLQFLQNQLYELEIQSNLWYDKKLNLKTDVPLIPTSAVTGEGLCDLLALLYQYAVSNQETNENLIFHSNLVQATVLEVRKVTGYGFTIDVIIRNGKIQTGQQFFVSTINGVQKKEVQFLLTPQEAKEMNQKNVTNYNRITSVQGAMGCKIAGEDFEPIVAGSEMIFLPVDWDQAVKNGDQTIFGDKFADYENQEQFEQAAIQYLQNSTQQVLKKHIQELGVTINANSLGALEAMNVEYKNVIQIRACNVGQVSKLQIQEASLMNDKGHKEYAVILCFALQVPEDIQREADTLGVKIICDEVIYRLKDQYLAYIKQLRDQEREQLKSKTVWPVIAQCIAVFNSHEPMIIGVKVLEGKLYKNTPICLVNNKQGGKLLGTIVSLEIDKKSVDFGVQGNEIAIRIATEGKLVAGKKGDFDIGATLCSRMGRNEIDLLKKLYRDELVEYVDCVKKIKALLGVD